MITRVLAQARGINLVGSRWSSANCRLSQPRNPSSRPSACSPEDRCATDHRSVGAPAGDPPRSAPNAADARSDRHIRRPARCASPVHRGREHAERSALETEHAFQTGTLDPGLHTRSWRPSRRLVPQTCSTSNTLLNFPHNAARRGVSNAPLLVRAETHCRWKRAQIRLAVFCVAVLPDRRGRLLHRDADGRSF